MKVLKAILTIILLVLILSIPKVILWLLNGAIRVSIVIKKTLEYLIKLVQEELNPSKHEKTTNP